MNSDDPNLVNVAESVAEFVESPQPAPPEPEPPDPVIPEPAAADPQAELRARMIAQFEQWLDQTLAGEPPPRGVPEHFLTEATATATGEQAGQETDLYRLFSALTGLTGEIGLQGRAFKQLTDLLSPLAQTPQTLERLEQAVEALAAPAEESADPAISYDHVCSVTIDLYDRLQRGLKTCDDGIQALTARSRQGWLHRWLNGPVADPPAVAAVQAIRDASALTLARLQAALQEWGVHRIGQIGEPFDPDQMTAVDVRVVDNVPPGTVLMVQRSGYAVNGTVKATAQVTVSKQSIDSRR